MPNSPPTICRCGSPRPRNQPCPKCGAGKRRGKHQLTNKQRGLGWDWVQFRAHMLATSENLCRDCEADGMVTPSAELHHKIKRSIAPELRLEPANVMGLCHRHHVARTKRGE